MENQRSTVWIGLTAAALILGAGYYWNSRANGSDIVPPDSPVPLPPSSDSPRTAVLIMPDTPFEGPFSAKVTLVEFLDYECPACAAYHPVIRQIRNEFKGKIKFAVRQFPLTETHRFAKGASIAAICAHRQGKFFEYGDALFANRENLKREDLEKYAADLGLDSAAFNACLDDPAVAEAVVRDRQDGQALGVMGTPTLFINGKRLDELPDAEGLRERINPLQF